MPRRDAQRHLAARARRVDEIDEPRRAGCLENGGRTRGLTELRREHERGEAARSCARRGDGALVQARVGPMLQ